jgi:hypothetical protein
MTYINIVELPYSRNPITNAKDFHARFIMQTHVGILRAVSRQTRCTVKICGDAYGVPVKYCDPYIFVYGNDHYNVDEAVQIITNAIKEKLRVERNWFWEEDSEQRRLTLLQRKYW